jgi:hypothetical protein
MSKYGNKNSLLTCESVTEEAEAVHRAYWRTLNALEEARLT